MKMGDEGRGRAPAFWGLLLLLLLLAPIGAGSEGQIWERDVCVCVRVCLPVEEGGRERGRARI